MPKIKLNSQDKSDLLKFVRDYSKNISDNDIDEIENKLDKKISSLKKKKNLPSYMPKMISQAEDLALLLNSPTISNENLDIVIAALHYFIWSEDKIPDYLPVVGYLDDAFIVEAIHKEVKKDIKTLKPVKKDEY